LTQIICGQLYDAIKDCATREIGLADLDALAPVKKQRFSDPDIIGAATPPEKTPTFVDGAMERHVDGLIRRLVPGLDDQSAFKALMTRLYLTQPDGTLTTALMPVADLRKAWTGNDPFDAVLAKARSQRWRLVRVSQGRVDGEMREFVSLGHDALAPVVAGWDGRRQKAGLVRKYVGRSWLAPGE